MKWPGKPGSSPPRAKLRFAWDVVRESYALHVAFGYVRSTLLSLVPRDRSVSLTDMLLPLVHTLLVPRRVCTRSSRLHSSSHSTTVLSSTSLRRFAPCLVESSPFVSRSELCSTLPFGQGPGFAGSFSGNSLKWPLESKIPYELTNLILKQVNNFRKKKKE